MERAALGQQLDGRLMADGSYGQKPKKQLSKTEAGDLIKEARERLQIAWEKDKRNRQEAALDLKFIAGDQWPDAVKTARERDGRPMLTINRLPQFLHQVTNPIREADLSIKTAPVDSNSDPQVAKVYDGLLKQIQYQSSMRTVIATAAEHQVGCGIGWVRICSDYAHDETFNQELRVKAIPNPLAVYDDPGAVEPDRCDSNWRFITQMMPKADFKAKYPKAAPVDVDRPSDGLEGIYWFTDDEVRVAEYWVRKPEKMTLALLADGQTVDLEKIKGLPLQIVRTRVVDCYKVCQYLISGADVLEGPTEVPGKYLPQVPFIGMEVPVESGTYRMSLIRPVRDPQALYNYYRTASAESIALAPKAPFIATAKMLERFQDQWSTANLKNRPFLLYDVDEAAPGARPERQMPPDMPASLVNEAMAAAEDMKGTTGIYDASLGGKSNETSGIAIDRRQIQGDTANYHFGDNVQRSLEHIGRILVDQIPHIYDTERTIRILGDGDDKEEFVPINKHISTDPMTGQEIFLNDLSQAKFDIRVRVGRSADSKRLETAQFMAEFVNALPPEARMLVMDLWAKNLDTPGSDEIAKRLRNMVPPQALVDPDDPNAQQAQDPMSDPAMQAQFAELSAKIEKLQAESRKTNAVAEGQEIENAMSAGAAQAGVHPMQNEARNAQMTERSAQLTADEQELSNHLNRDQAQRGQHEKQAPYAEIARQLEEAQAAKRSGQVH
jgi:hypothetical protein